MRTKIQCSWLVGYVGNGHVLWRDAELVYEDTQIVFVGERFEGAADQVIDAGGKLVIPGFIDTHVHSGHRASHRLISDVGRPDYFGQPFFEISVPRAGTRVGGDPRYARSDDALAADELLLNARFTGAALLRNGITTFVEFGSQLKVQEALDAQINDLGIRAYLGPGFHNGRLRGILVPREVETCTPALLRAAAREAYARKLPVAIHAAYNVHEFYDIIREHRKTSIELLEEVGLMSSTLNVGHGNFVAENPLMNYSGGRDLEIMGAYGCSVSHCPVNIARRARFLDSWERYRKAGVNIALGTDTYPRDMIMQMRSASYFGKVASRNLRAASAAEVFEAATLGGAGSLGRDDLGRLAPGAKADIVVIDLSGRGSLRMGPVRDPIKSLVECGIGDDVDTVIVDGIVRVEGGRIKGVDFGALRARTQAAGERIWASWADWDPLGRSANEMCPFAFPRAH